MKNIDVIEKFFKEEGREKAKTQHLYIETENRQLINYNTVIAQWNGYEEQTQELVIDVNYYSTTTSKIQTYIMRTARKMREQGKLFFVVMNGTEKRILQYEKILKGE